MLNDINLYTLNIDQVDDITKRTKNTFSENIPYKLYSTSDDRDAHLVVFGNHFIETMRQVLSEPEGGCIVKMSTREQKLYFDFVDYQNDVLVPTPGSELEEVLIALDTCIADELQCKTATFINRCFDSTHDWDSCEQEPMVLPTLSVALTLTEYEALVPVITTLYVISEAGVVTKVAIGSNVVWTLV